MCIRDRNVNDNYWYGDVEYYNGAEAVSYTHLKQMIGDIAIMRNPWPIFSIAALSGAACLIYDHFFSYETMWIAAVSYTHLAVLVLCKKI